MAHIDLTPITQSEAFCDFLGITRGGKIDFALLGHGEYNINYIFQKPAAPQDKLVLRIPMGSQMHLENQVRYEYEALGLLLPSGRTPKPLYIDDTKAHIPYGFLVMEFLPGRPLRYESDLAQAAACLADIHNLEISPGSHLLAPENPLAAVLQECHAMAGHYLNSPLAAPEVARLITSLLAMGQKILDAAKDSGKRCLINTELNSGNFLVNDDITYLVDWEKPLYACPGQDLGHFLAPTTTLWKTDTILGNDDIRRFMESYCNAGGRGNCPDALWQATQPYFIMTCLRGITWCAMAWIEYQSPDRPLKDAFTFEKIEYYLRPEFLEMILRDYFNA
ncbi:MAG: phosphotransferase [Clostridiales bacterium]|nr:phosphotransferase [Clostridiales bacterium]